MIARASRRVFAIGLAPARAAACLLTCALAVSQPAADQTPPKPGAKPAAPQAPATKPAAAPADITVKTKYITGAQMSENITHIKGTRQRVEFPGATVIDQCDLQRSIIVNDEEKRYRIQPKRTANSGAPAADASSTPAKTGGVVTYATTLADTLERKTVFGLEARRVKTTIVRQASAEACDRTAERTEIDAWYVDVPARLQCDAPAEPAPAAKASCVDRVESTVTGDVKLGFPVSMRTTTTTGEGDKQDVISNSMEVVDLQLTTLDAGLFEIPKGYVEASSGAEVLPSLAKGGSLSEALFGSTADGTSAAAPKQAGVIRIGVLEPINRTTRDLQTRSLREDLVAKYRKAPFEALPIGGSSPEAVAQDAARLECDYVLVTEVVEVKTSKPGKVGGMLRRVSGDDTTQMKHDVSIDYRLYAIAEIQKPRVSGTGKATSGGFGVGSALRVAAFAGQTYMSVMGMGGVASSLMSMPGVAGGLGSAGGMGLFDPRMSAMGSMAQMAQVGMGAVMGGGAGTTGPEDAGLPETISTATSNIAKATTDELRKTRK